MCRGAYIRNLVSIRYLENLPPIKTLKKRREELWLMSVSSVKIFETESMLKMWLVKYDLDYSTEVNLFFSADVTIAQSD